MSNPFFKNEGPFEASFLCQIMNIDSNIDSKNILDCAITVPVIALDITRDQNKLI